MAGDSPNLQRYAGRPLTFPSFSPGSLRLTWEDGNGERSCDFDIDVWSVDRAGNMSAEPPRVHVDSGGEGCAAAARSSGASWMALLSLALAWRQRALAARRSSSR